MTPSESKAEFHRWLTRPRGPAKPIINGDRPMSTELGTEPVYGACCDKARSRSCVCVESTSCPVHGVRCRGSHD